MDLLEDFNNEWGKQFIPSKKPFLLALSGGMDSMCLLELCSKLNIKVQAAHCNYGLRGSESDQDEEFVQQECDRRGIQLHIKRVKLEGAGNVQERARSIRYGWFKRAMEIHDLGGILIAHHADDQIETFLLNLMRGSGLQGLSAMDQISESIYRPLLKYRKAQIEEFVQQHEVNFREDSSNRSQKYTRNRVRNELIPLMNDIRSGSDSAVLRAIENLHSSTVDLERYFAALRSKLIEHKKDGFWIDRTAQEIAYSGFLFSELLPLGFSRDQVNAVIECREIGSEFLSNQKRLTVDRTHLILTDLVGTGHKECVINNIPNMLEEPVALKFDWIDAGSVEFGAGVEYFDKESIQLPLTLRRWKPGDRMQPLGMKGSQLISDILINDKVPRPAKESTYVLCAQDDVIWLVGNRISEQHKVTKDTGQVLRVRFISKT